MLSATGQFTYSSTALPSTLAYFTAGLLVVRVVLLLFVWPDWGGGGADHQR